ncbi:NUDIX hydrolase [Paenibacillus sp. FJAT-27812]|uniref:NUDIX hydrolase n=1 Tax=Paenibacillus sp. FJAT-27812 TaxID=1684143 RepID=UPI0006A760AF|nr:NUDIX hydrolase [Paenibacillus sp. FJAT-27812]
MGYMMDLRSLVGTRPLIMAGACVLLCKEDSLLLQRRSDNGFWGLPGGAMEPGEALTEVARRELLEETGLIAGSLALFDVFSGPELYYKYPHGDEVYNVSTAYICSDFEGMLKEDGTETLELRFFEFDSIPQELSPPDRPVIHAFLERFIINKNNPEGGA